MFDRLLIAIDPEDDGEGKRALETGLKLLAEGGDMHLVSVFDPGGSTFFPHVNEDAPEQRESEVRGLLDLLARKYLPLNVEAKLHVVGGDTGEALVALAGTLEADLMVLVSRGASGHWHLRRHTVEHVAVSSPCAVLVLPAQD